MFCTNCGCQLPIEAKFCPSCGNEVKIVSSSDSCSENQVLTEPIPIEKEAPQRHENSTHVNAITKCKEQMKLSHLLNIVCDGIMFLYALLIPEAKLHSDYETLTTLFLMIGVDFLGVILLILGTVYAMKTYDATLGQPGAWKTTKISSSDQADLKYSGKFYAGISSALVIGALFVLFIRSSI